MTDVSYYGNNNNNNNNNSSQQQQSAAPPAAAAKQQQQTDQGKIFVGGLSWQTTEESLRWHFEQYGQVVSVEVMKNRITGEPRGFAFVVFQDHTTVDVVMNEPVHEINHKVVDVKRAQARGIAPPSIHHHHQNQQNQHQHPNNNKHPSPRDDSNNNNANTTNNNANLTPEQLQNKVFVGGIPPVVDKEELRHIFEQFGAVVDAVVMLDQNTSRSRGFGFVTFENGSGGAQAAVAAQPLPMHGRRVEVKLATPRAENQHHNKQQQQYRQHHQQQPAGSKHVGLRAGQTSLTAAAGEFAGLAVAFGRNGWKAGFGSFAFSRAGWAVQGWDDDDDNDDNDTTTTRSVLPERSGFSFDMIPTAGGEEPPLKRARVQQEQEQQQW